jgi:two-component system cell cycle sensor histidine kinase/response regulator CckA
MSASGCDAPSAFSGADDFFEMSIDNVCVAGLDGYFKRVNPSWTRTLGWTPEELMSRPSVDFVYPEDREATLAGRRRLQSGEALGPLVNRYVCKDGTYRWFEWRSVANIDRALVYAVARDITEQKIAEQQLSEAKELQEKLQSQLVFADRMACVGALAAGVAHEINNPLAYVAANITLMAESLRALTVEVSSDTLSELCEMAGQVQEGAERIRKIVRGLKTFSRTEEERRTVVDVRPLLELSINMAFNEIRHRARLVKDYGPIPLVDADEARLGQVFINLLVNAAQALPEGRSGDNEIRIVTSTDAAGHAVIEVRDTGAGIPAGLLHRVFEPFFTTKQAGIGTGLGLSICHNIVVALGGEISVTSEEGVGTAFRLVLPATLRARDAAPPIASAPMQALPCAAVLVLDDEPAIGSVLRRVLREHDVTVVTTAREALELLRSGKHFDIIFSDLMMPEMSGMDFYAELTRGFPHATERVIFVSGGAFTASAQAFLDTIPNQRLEKPFNAGNVRDIVRDIVRRDVANRAADLAGEAAERAVG